MATKNMPLYFDPVSQGLCDMQNCQNPAKYRASWAQGIVVKLVCAAHKADVEGKLFEEVGASTFLDTRRPR
jgi:hypothetical protein